MESPDSFSDGAVEQLSLVFGSEHEEGVSLETGTSLADVRAFLEEKIAGLLKHNPILLMSLLYRIDVPEQAVKEAFLLAPNGALAGELADLIIARQLQKVRIRRTFQEGPPSSSAT